MSAHKYLQDTNRGEPESESERVWCGHQEQELLQFLTYIRKENRPQISSGFIQNHLQQFNLSWSSTCAQWWNSCLDSCIYTSPGAGLNSPTKFTAVFSLLHHSQLKWEQQVVTTHSSIYKNWPKYRFFIRAQYSMATMTNVFAFQDADATWVEKMTWIAGTIEEWKTIL